VLEQDHRRDRADAEASGGDRIGVDVKLGDLDLLALLVRDLLEDRRDHPTGPAPRRPEVDEHRCLRLQDILLEVCVTRLLRLSHLYRSLRQGHLGGTHHHLNANCCPICSTSGERPKTGSSKSSARSGRALRIGLKIAQNAAPFAERVRQRPTLEVASDVGLEAKSVSGIEKLRREERLIRLTADERVFIAKMPAAIFGLLTVRGDAALDE